MLVTVFYIYMGVWGTKLYQMPEKYLKILLGCIVFNICLFYELLNFPQKPKWE